jgi:tRNA wybutosine-synthesizing protein 1
MSNTDVPSIDAKLQNLTDIGYRILGQHRHSAVKPCEWLKRSLRGQGHCYKQQFYGIESHRCMQFTPSLQFCTLGCKFCWRDTSFTYPKWNIKSKGKTVADSPNEILDEATYQQQQLLMGFKGNDKVDLKKWKESQSPKHLAISLAGEPTLYPLISDLILETKKRKMTSFLVTNGTQPKVLQDMDLPTQLYVTVAAPNEEIYRKTCNPLQKSAWKNLNSTLQLFPSLDTRKVVRLTLAKGLNFLNPDIYSKLISKAEPDFVEVKAFMSVGFSRVRIPYGDMPSHDEIKGFAEIISSEISYPVADEKRDSRVVLLSKSGKKKKIK